MIGRLILLLVLAASVSWKGVAQEPTTPSATPDPNATPGQQPNGQQTPPPPGGQPGQPAKPGQKPPAKPAAPPPIVVLQPPPPPPMRKIQVDFDLAVTDAQGKPQAGITTKDLAIRVDDQPVSAESIHGFAGTADKGEPPVQLYFVLDLVNTTPEEWPVLRAQVAKFLRENDGQLAYPTSLINFLPDELQVQSQPLTNGKGMANALEKMPGPAGNGEFNPFDASLQAMQSILDSLADKPGRKLLIWIGPGWQTPSSLAQSVTARDEDLNWNTLVAITNRLRQERVVLFGGRDGDSAHGDGSDGLRSAAQMNLANLGLNSMAVRSGGRGFVSQGKDDAYVGEIERDVLEAGPYFRITIMPEHADGEDTYHAVKIAVGRAGLTAQAITGYFNEVTVQK
ncbi:MAG TPA: hypothetical protein VK716_08985 [Terracidiphilus sp.]|nr:hypothetical protein [Terracidiphilus sp.]